MRFAAGAAVFCVFLGLRSDFDTPTAGAFSLASPLLRSWLPLGFVGNPRPEHRPLHRREHQTGDDRAIGGAVCITIDRLIGGANLPKHRPPHRIGGGGGSDGGNVGAFSGVFGRFVREDVILYLYRRKTAKTG